MRYELLRISFIAKIGEVKESTTKIEIPNYAAGFRAVNKSEDKKNCEGFFENSESSKHYLIFH